MMLKHQLNQKLQVRNSIAMRFKMTKIFERNRFENRGQRVHYVIVLIQMKFSGHAGENPIVYTAKSLINSIKEKKSAKCKKVKVIEDDARPGCSGYTTPKQHYDANASIASAANHYVTSQDNDAMHNSDDGVDTQN